ncbi:MAG: hypothetical protein Greene041662_803, partial [Candidatus Peregrinibacteria bacterium Greene0416_62]
MIEIDASTPYTDSVQLNEGGSIHYLDPNARRFLGPSDNYAHLESKLLGMRTVESRESQLKADQPAFDQRPRGLREENTRDLCTLGREAISRIASSGKEQPQLFFFGPGAGREIAQAKTMLPEATIRSNALTPASPTLALQKDFMS